MQALFPAAVCLLGTALFAQTPMTFVLPKGADKLLTENNDQSYLGRAGANYNGTTVYTPIHVQSGFATADMPVPVAKVTGLAFRRNNYYSNTMYASQTDMIVHMSTTNLAPSSYSTTFANNEGANRTQVFGSGTTPATLNWPAAPKGTGVAPFIFKIPFSQPFVLIQGTANGITIDYMITKRVSQYTSGSNTYNAPLFLDAAGTTYGNRTRNGNYASNCKFSNGNAQSNLGYTRGGLTEKGGTWYVRYGTAPNGQVVGIGALGFSGVSNPVLPIDLTPLGMPNCEWNISLELGWFPLQTTQLGSNWYVQWPNIQIPAGLKPGTKFYEQALIFDQGANAAGIIATQSSEWTIEKFYEPSDAVTVYTYNTASSTYRRTKFATVTQLEYQ